MTDHESELIQQQIIKYDETKLIEFVKKMLLINGRFLGFRGNQEHYDLRVDHIGSGIFPKSIKIFGGMEYCGVVTFPQHKTKKLGMSSSYLKDFENVGTFPVLPHLPEQDIGGAYKRFVALLPKDSKCKKFFRRINKKENKFYANMPMGPDTIRKLGQEAFADAGLSSYKTCHSLRGAFISALANDPSINDSERMAAARHRSVTSNAGYQARGGTSSLARISNIVGSVVDGEGNSEDTIMKKSFKELALDEKKPSAPALKTLDSPDVSPIILKGNRRTSRAGNAMDFENQYSPISEYQPPNFQPQASSGAMSFYTQQEYNGLQDDLQNVHHQRTSRTSHNYHSMSVNTQREFNALQNEI